MGEIFKRPELRDEMMASYVSDGYRNQLRVLVAALISCQGDSHVRVKDFGRLNILKRKLESSNLVRST